MGRPLPRKFFENDELRIPVTANLGNGNVDAWLIGQEGTGVYWATDGEDTALVTLINGTPSEVGEAQCVVLTESEEEKNVRQINMNDVKTFDGVTLKWVYESPITGQGAFKSGSEGKEKDANAESFDVDITTEFDRHWTVGNDELNTDYAQFEFELPAGSYEGMFLTVTRNRATPDYWPLSSAYDAGGTFFLTAQVRPWDEESIMVFRISESSDGSTPTLLISDEISVFPRYSELPQLLMELNLDSRFEDSLVATDQIRPEWNVMFPSGGATDGAEFIILARLNPENWGDPEESFREIYSAFITDNMIQNGFVAASGFDLTSGEYLISAYYRNTDDELSPCFDYDLTVTLP